MKVSALLVVGYCGMVFVWGWLGIALAAAHLALMLLFVPRR